jgi:sporulation protein YlmC with PRC-barrel domain
LSVVHLEKVVAKKIRDSDGQVAGRLEEVHADWRGGECVVTHYVIASKGTYALQQIGFKKRTRSYIVPWDRMDFSDPEKPRLNCRIDELTAIRIE